MRWERLGVTARYRTCCPRSCKARTKPGTLATQSTTLFGGGAANAINGDIRGDPTHTDVGDPRPWWEVRLSQDAAIDTVVLWNRIELPERLANFAVVV